jgi:hypothetical protein
VAADFRYAYWCVLATLAGAVAAMLAYRGRREHPRRGDLPANPAADAMSSA